MDQEAKFYKAAEEREQHMQDLDRQAARRSILRILVPLVLIAAFAVGGFFAYEHYGHMLFPPPPEDPRVGTKVKLGEVSVQVVHYGQVPINDNGVDGFVLLALIGNAGERPMKEPNLEVHLIDRDGRLHAPDPQGVKFPGREKIMNPDLYFTFFWIFKVTSSADYIALEVRDHADLVQRIDLTKRTPENEQLLKDAEEHSMRALRERQSKFYRPAHGQEVVFDFGPNDPAARRSTPSASPTRDEILQARQEADAAKRRERLQGYLDREEAAIEQATKTHEEAAQKLEDLHAEVVKVEKAMKGYERRVKDYQRSSAYEYKFVKSAQDMVANWKAQAAGATGRDADNAAYQINKHQATLNSALVKYEREQSKLKEYTTKFNTAEAEYKAAKRKENEQASRLAIAERNLNSHKEKAEELRTELEAETNP